MPPPVSRQPSLNGSNAAARLLCFREIETWIVIGRQLARRFDGIAKRRTNVFPHSGPLGPENILCSLVPLMRDIQYQYVDPLEVIWRHAAARMGMRIKRSCDVFAAWDGNGELTIGTPETLDADDSMAQMILHETCHALIEGPDAFDKADWGVELDNPAHRVREHAALRLQAALAAPHGLRQFFAATTSFRRYYDQLPRDPLAENGDPAVPLARAGWQRATTGLWSQPLQSALQATATIAALVHPVAQRDSLWAVAMSPSPRTLTPDEGA